VSRHHTLPPIIYTPPPPETKKTRRKRGVGYASAAREADDAEELEDGAPLHGLPVLPRHSRPVENVERRVPSPNGKLSDDTLRAMLDLQELETK
jgi:hypothetical protein